VSSLTWASSLVIDIRSMAKRAEKHIHEAESNMFEGDGEHLCHTGTGLSQLVFLVPPDLLTTNTCYL
jgi:hypothetical protein